MSGISSRTISSRSGPLVNKGAKNDMKVSSENALKGPVCFPSRVEQESISAFFSVLDNLITLHQRQPFLHSTPEISLTVQLIHPFYTSSWEQRKLGDIASDRVAGGDIDKDLILAEAEGEEVVTGLAIAEPSVRPAAAERSPFMPSPPGGKNKMR